MSYLKPLIESLLKKGRCLKLNIKYSYVIHTFYVLIVNDRVKMRTLNFKGVSLVLRNEVHLSILYDNVLF